MNDINNLANIWKNLYPNVEVSLLLDFLKSIENYKPQKSDIQNADWYKNAVVYSLYVDKFNNNFKGLEDKLDYLQNLGVTCIWLLPILKSPMRDAGFDISNHFSIREDLFSDVNSNQNETFKQFIKKAHERNIKIIFDFAINHTSDEHPWFVESKKSKDNPYRNFYIWDDINTKYSDARIIFKGIEESNWEKYNDQYFFHRFFNFQPDLNYRNPQVLFAMTRAMVYWQNIGIDGFRADAIPYLWKEEGTDCENLTQTHLIVKFFRAVLDYISPGTLLLAEACQQPQKVVEYLGNGDECHAAYHFPLMPRIYKSLAMEDRNPIINTLKPEFTPQIPESCQWFTFLRCHDELSLELVYVTEEERKYIHQQYCLKPLWDFRKGEGISSRLAELMSKNPEKILLAYSIILTLPGTPVIYYGDEVATLNDEKLYFDTIKETGKDDTRFLIRNYLDWDFIDKQLNDNDSLSSKVYYSLQKMIKTRNALNIFGSTEIEFCEEFSNNSLLVYRRKKQDKSILVVQNLSKTEQNIDNIINNNYLKKDILNKEIQKNIAPWDFYWIDENKK